MAQSIPIECSGLHAAWLKSYRLNAVDSMQRDWMQWIPCTVKNGTLLNAVDFMQHGPKHPDWMQWIPCSVIEWRGFHALWCNGSRLYTVDSMQWGPMHPDWMQCVLCSMAKSIPIECSWFHALGLNAVYCMHCDWIQITPCSVVKCIPSECSELHALC